MRLGFTNMTAVDLPGAAGALSGVHGQGRGFRPQPSETAARRFANALTSGINGSELLVFETCAHAPIYQSTAEFNEKTLSFLNRHTVRPAPRPPQLAASLLFACRSLARHVTCRNAAIWSRSSGKRTSRRHRWSVENDPRSRRRYLTTGRDKWLVNFIDRTFATGGHSL